jgi:hypothetical protein
VSEVRTASDALVDYLRRAHIDDDEDTPPESLVYEDYLERRAQLAVDLLWDLVQSAPSAVAAALAERGVET